MPYDRRNCSVYTEVTLKNCVRDMSVSVEKGTPCCLLLFLSAWQSGNSSGLCLILAWCKDSTIQRPQGL